MHPLLDKYHILIFSEVEDFLTKIPETDSAKILAHISFLKTGDFITVSVKTLRSPLKELRVKKYRIIFFIQDSHLYIISCFIKKTQKTPLREIDRAFQLFRSFE